MPAEAIQMPSSSANSPAGRTPRDMAEKLHQVLLDDLDPRCVCAHVRLKGSTSMTNAVGLHWESNAKPRTRRRVSCNVLRLAALIRIWYRNSFWTRATGASAGPMIFNPSGGGVSSIPISRAHAHGHLLILVPNQDIGQGAERRVAQGSPELQFLLVEQPAIVRGGETDGIVLGLDGLHQDDARDVAASRAPGHLRQQLEGALGRPEVRHAQSDVGVHYAHQRDVRDVVALGDHLRAHQNVITAFAESVQDGLVGALPGHGVAVHARDARLGKLPVQLFFHPLATDAQKVDVLALALGAELGDRLGVIAVVAQHAAVAPVERKRHRTVNALQPLAASPAGEEAGEATPVQQQHGLLAVGEPFADGADELPGESGLLARLEEFGPHVDERHLGQGTLFDALGEFEQRVLAPIGVVAALHAGRGRAQNDAGPRGLCPHNRHVAAVVAGGLVLLVALVVLLVDDDEAEVAHGSENTRACPHDHRRLPGANPAPLFGALGCR